MNQTVAKTYRISAGVHNLVVTEAERLDTSEADVVRLAIRQYFDNRMQEDKLYSFEQRLNVAMQKESANLTALLRQILSLAKP